MCHCNRYLRNGVLPVIVLPITFTSVGGGGGAEKERECKTEIVCVGMRNLVYLSECVRARACAYRYVPAFVGVNVNYT